MKYRTLVIHPQDPTTDFLKEIYRGKCWKVLSTPADMENLNIEIERSDRVVMLGHGTQFGLLNIWWHDLNSHYIIDHRHKDLLKEKECVFIWCHADKFVQKHGLSGFNTGMFISEMEEARMYDVAATEGEIDLSNKLFAMAVREYLFDFLMCEKVKGVYYSEKAPVMRFNQERLFETIPDIKFDEELDFDDLVLKSENDRLKKFQKDGVFVDEETSYRQADIELVPFSKEAYQEFKKSKNTKKSLV